MNNGHKNVVNIIPNLIKSIPIFLDIESYDSETSHRRSRDGRRWSAIWFYYDRIDGNAVCKICSASMKSNTIRHLQRLHPLAYKDWQTKRKELHELYKEKDSDGELVASPPNPKGQSKRSSIWLFYRNLNGTATCNICGLAMKNNKIRHLRKKHPATYIKWHNIRQKNNEYPWLNKAGVEAPPRKNQSAVWLFYKKVDGYAVCKTCGTFMRYNKIRHLQKRHPTVYRKWQSIRKENNEFKLLAKEHSRSLWVKQYTKQIEINKYRCELCHTTIQMRENEYGNMKRHIRLKHPYIYDQEMRECREVQKNKYAVTGKITDDTVEYVVEYIDNDPLIDDGDLISVISKSEENQIKDEDVNSINADKEEIEKYEESKNTDDSDDTDDHLELSELLRDNDPLIENKIQQLCNKSVDDKRQASKTCFWNFFDVLDKNHLYRCLFCGQQMAIFPKSISNLKRHLKKKHIWQYNLILKYAPENDSCKSSRSKTTEIKHYSENASNEEFNFMDSDRFKCKICEEMVICGDDKKILFDHFMEKHPESVERCTSEDAINGDGEYKVIIDADDNSYIIAV